MTASIFVLLFVLFPPPEYAGAHTDAVPFIQAAQVPGLAKCEAMAADLKAEAKAQYPTAENRVGCIEVPAPDPVAVAPGLQPDGNFLDNGGNVTKPGDPL